MKNRFLRTLLPLMMALCLILAATPFAAAEEVPTLTVMVAKSPLHGAFSEMSVFTKTEEELGIKINWIEVPEAEATEKVNLSLVSGDLPDIYMGLLKPLDIVKYLDEGIFLPVEDRIENSTYLKEILEKRPQYKAMLTAPDGHIYSFPYIEEMHGLILTQGIHYLYKPWMDKLGLTMPTTTDEYEAVLKAFYEQDPNGNGIQDEIPFSFVYKTSQSWRNANDIGALWGAFGMPDTGLHVTVVDGKVVSTAMGESYKAGLEYFNRLYSEGLIDMESFTQQESQRTAKLQNETPIIGSTLVWCSDQVVLPGNENEWAPVPPLTGPNGDRMWVHDTVHEMHGVARGVITTACKDPDLAVKFLDRLYEPERSVEINWGAIDSIYAKDDKGVMRWIPNDGTQTHADRRFKNAPGGTCPNVILNEYYDKVVEYPQDAQYRYDEMVACGYLELMPKENLPLEQLWFLPDENERLSVLLTEVNSYIDENRARFIIDGGIENDYQMYEEQLKSMGIDEMLTIIQKGYDRYLEAMKSA
jgi:putative aldouronate transport system substrate-binding protein